MKQHMNRGITLFQVLVAILASIVILLIWSVNFGGRTRGGTPRHLRDGYQLLAISQGLAIWAQNNDGTYPLPSLLDADDNTITGVHPLQKDITGNIYSILVYNGLNPTEMFVSPSEVSAQIEEYDNYEFIDPQAAANPALALWDPAFRSSPDQPGDGPYAHIGHTSYAHQPTFGKRAKTWAFTESATEAVLANRGPEYVGESNAWRLAIGEKGQESITLNIHGKRDSWSGNIAFNDQHVDFKNRPDPERLTLDGGQPDNIFVNENDTTGRPADNLDKTNAFLRIVHTITGVSPDDNTPTLSWNDFFID